MLRHTFATQLVNAGCPITTIQALMGHKRLSTTLIYTQIHNETVAEDYFTAMEMVEQRLVNQLPPEQDVEVSPSNDTTSHLLKLVDGLQKEPLTDNQQDLLSELGQRLVALAAAVPGIEMLSNKHIVNEQAIPSP